MVEERDRLEMERLLNLVQGFGWKEVKREETDTQIVITLVKPKFEVTAPSGLGAG